LRLAEIHDLSRVISKGSLVYPGDPEPRLDPLSTIDNDGVNVTRITLGSHTGTHVDAQSHFLANGNRVENEPLKKFAGEALVIDASRKHGEGITRQDLENHKVNAGDIILLYTGTGGTATRFAYLEVSAAEWVVEHSVKCVGIDTLSLEKYGRKDAPVHKMLLGKNIGIVENLANLEKFVNRRLFFVCLPLPLGGADGSPARAVFFEMIK
jgi:kynurenine formamidase